MLRLSPSDQNLVHLPGNVIDMMTSGFSKLTQRQREQLLIHLIQKWLEKVNPGLDAKFVPQNFFPLVAKAMSVLHAGKKDNLIYHAARCFGEQRHVNFGPRMPLDRMPFGLIANNLKILHPTKFPILKLQMTTGIGVSPCTLCLETSEPQCTWGQCGPMK